MNPEEMYFVPETCFAFIVKFQLLYSLRDDLIITSKLSVFTSDAWVTSALPCGHVTARPSHREATPLSGVRRRGRVNIQQSIGSLRPPRIVVVLSRTSTDRTSIVQPFLLTFEGNLLNAKTTLSMLFKYLRLLR